MSNYKEYYMIYHCRDIYGDFDDAEHTFCKNDSEAIEWAKNKIAQLRTHCDYGYRINGGTLYCYERVIATID